MRFVLHASAAALAAGLAAFAAPASAQTPAQQWDRCGNVNNAHSVEVRIAACTALVAARAEPPARISEALNNRAWAWLDQGDVDRAAADLDEALRLDPTAAGPHLNYGVIHYRRGDRARALAEFSEAIRLSPDYAQAYANRGYTYEVLGDSARALADYRQSLRLDPNRTDAREWLCRLLNATSPGSEETRATCGGADAKAE